MHWKSTWSVLILSLLVLGCSRDEIRVYDAPREKVAARTDLPPGWEEAESGGMRAGSYTVRGAPGQEAQVSIIPFPGSGGSELENVNRWRNQLGLPPTTAEALEKDAQPVEIAGEQARMFEMSGTVADKKTRTLAASLKHDEVVWFFKMMGDDELVREQKPVFVQFLATYKIPHESATDASSEPKPEDEKPPTWTVPEGWRETAPGPQQMAKFDIENGKATASLVVMSGSGGGLLMNINRWRVQQLGLPAATESDLGKLAEPFEADGVKATVVDMTGPKERMVAAIVPRGDKTWYYKLMGEPGVVAAQKKSFMQFVQSSK